MRKLGTLLCALALVTTAAAQLNDVEKNAALAANNYRVLPNLTYFRANNTDLKLDVYQPRTAVGTNGTPVPVVIEIHGGGWIAGTKEGSQLTVEPYLAWNMAVVNVEYRLGQASPAPAAVEDCRCALRWVWRNAKRYNFDTTKIVVTGGSAGGHLALTTGMLPANGEFDRACLADEADTWAGPGTQNEPKVAAIVNWFGITDVTAMLAGPEARGYAIAWFGSMHENARKQTADHVSPVNLVRAGGPAVITIHGDKDSLVPYAQGQRLHAALQKAGVRNTLITIPGGDHGGFSNDEQVRAFTAIKEFLQGEKILPSTK